MVWRRPTCLTCVSPFRPWQLRSADSGTLVVPRTRTTIGQRDSAFGLSDMEQPRCQTADFNCVHRDICTKTQKSSLRLLAPLRTLSNWRYINLRIYSFIHSFANFLYSVCLSKLVESRHGNGNDKGYVACIMLTLDVWLYPVTWPGHFPGLGNADVAGEDVENQKAIN